MRKKYPDPTTPLAVFLEVTDLARGQFHTGFIFYRDGGLVQADLAWHLNFKLRQLPLGELSRWAPLRQLDEENTRAVIYALEHLVDHHQDQIPYSVASEGIVFIDGVLQAPENGKGLTCATFVTDFLKSLGIDLIDLTNWEEREGDLEWKQFIIRAMSWTCVPPDHISPQIQRLGESVRIRPNDVYTAVRLFKDSPLRFSDLSFPSGRTAESMLE